MGLKEILSQRISFAGKKSSERFNDSEFRRVIEVRENVTNDETGTDEEIVRRVTKIIASGAGSHKNSVTLVPMKSLSLEDFTFPAAWGGLIFCGAYDILGLTR